MSLNLLSIMDGSRTLQSGFTIGEMVQVCILGVGIVFVGLVCIVFLSSIMSKVVGAIEKSEAKAQPPVQAGTAVEPIANKQELIAVVSAVIAEEMGTDVEAIRIKSIKKI